MKSAKAIAAASLLLFGCAEMMTSSSSSRQSQEQAGGSAVMPGHATVGATDYALAGRRRAQKDPPPHDEARCEAYEALARCDESDCQDACIARYEDDASRTTCMDKCAAKYRRAMRRPVQRYTCPYDICDEDNFNRIVEIAYTRQEQCHWTCDRPSKPQPPSAEWDECNMDCYTKCVNKILHRCPTLYAENCSEQLTAAWCESEAPPPCELREEP